MPRKRNTILSTRPMALSQIEKAKAEYIDLECNAFIDTIADMDPKNVEEIKKLAEQKLVTVFTSMNAADAVAGGLKDVQPAWKIFGLGTTTKKILQEKFPNSIIVGGAENAAALADEIIAEGNIQSVIFFCGDQRRDELPQKLKKQGIGVMEIIVYKTISQPHIIQKTYDGIMFFSPSAVESFFVNNQVAAETVLFAIGRTTAQTIEQYSTNKVITSNHPGKEELVSKVILYFNTINQQQ